MVAATAKEIFPNEAGLKGEIVTRYVQNLTGGDLYLAFGVTNCNTTDTYHALLSSGQLFDCFPHRLSVWGYSVDGGVVSTVKLTRVQL